MKSKIGIAAGELVKGNFRNALAALTTKTVSSQLIQPARYRGGNFFFGVNGADKAFVWGNYNSSLTAYQQNPIVSTIINRHAQAYMNGVVKIVKSDGKESQTPEAKAIRKKLNNPNPVQSGLEFRAQGKVYQKIYGYCPVLVVKPVGFEKDFSAWVFWNMPPWMLHVQDSTDLFFNPEARKFRSITLTYMGQSVELINNPNLDVFFLKEPQISTSTYNYTTADNASIHLPDSKLHALELPISNIIDSLKSANSIITQRGPMWILSNDDNSSNEAGPFPVNPEHKEALELDFEKYGILRGQKKAIITDAKLKLQEVGFNLDQLKLHEEILQDAKMICDGLNYPPFLLGLIDSKYNNMDVAERGWYQNAIIPDANSDCEQWTQYFGIDQKDLSITIDFSHLQVFQQNKVEEGKALLYLSQALQTAWRNDWVTWNEIRKAIGYEGVDGMDKYLSQLIQEGKIDPQTLQPTGGVTITETTLNQNANDN